MNSMGLLFCAAFGAFMYWLGWYNTNKQWNDWNAKRIAGEKRRASLRTDQYWGGGTR